VPAINREENSMSDVKIVIKYLVTVKNMTGHSKEEVSFSGGSKLQNVVDWLKERYAISLPDPRIMAILNGKGWEQLPLKLSTVLNEGDIICLFPPIAGG
jgi:molybdopterin converting factor small subunit